MKKTILILFTFLLLLTAAAAAQEEPEAVSSAEDFTDIKVRNPFDINGQTQYYRFPDDTWFYEPIDLEYFPHDAWNKRSWALLGRWGNGYTYNQMIYTDHPVASKQLIHGTAVTNIYGFLNDFYLYADVFIYDNYPQNTGSCYIYYSNSLLTGYYESKGILIDPESGIYEVTNSYGGERIKIYNPALIKHSIELLEEHSPDEYDYDPDNLAGSSVGAASHPLERLDENFSAAYEKLTSGLRMEASPEVKAYRIEVIRISGVSDIYINGKKVTSFEDPIRTTAEDESIVPDRVSWSYGPILNPEGMTVTCGIGDLRIFAPIKKGE